MRYFLRARLLVFEVVPRRPGATQTPCFAQCVGSRIPRPTILFMSEGLIQGTSDLFNPVHVSGIRGYPFGDRPYRL